MTALFQRSLLVGKLSNEQLILSYSCMGIQRQVTSAIQHDPDAEVTGESHESPSVSGRETSANIPDWEWRWVLGKSKGRKPAVKRPNLHQWYYCNPNYDPNKDLPKVLRSPYAPPLAYERSDREEYQRHLRLHPEEGPDTQCRRSDFRRFQKLRELDWREAFQRGVSEDTKQAQKRERWEAEAKRQASWRLYKEAIFERARLAGEQK